LGAQEELSYELCREVGERLVVVAWHEQAVAREDGAGVEEGYRSVVVEHDVGRPLTGDDVTEDTTRLSHRARLLPARRVSAG
jgi:hypothetical protein